MTKAFNPLTAAPPEEVPLANAPLVRVLAQVRFPLIASIEKEEFIAPFQEVIRKEYPVLRQERESGVIIGPGGVSGGQSKPVWRFNDLTDEWRVSLAPNFAALETRAYTSRNDFLGRLQTILAALKDHIDPPLVDRLGVRYVDRVRGDDVADFRTLIEPELGGILATDLEECVQHALSESLFTLPDGTGNMLARWAWLPPGSTVDPSAIEPLNERSWILDLDAFVTGKIPFDVDDLGNRARGFAERIYTFFRWAVTEEFLRRYGGEI